MPLTDERLTEIAARLTGVPGIVGVALGGSRARDEHTPGSDTDLGLYYHRPLDVGRLGELARELAGDTASVTEPGGWGPWVDGGGWLRIDGHAVDWIYRDLDRVLAVQDGCAGGHYAFHQQTGHPFGFADFAYAGELALGRILSDPAGRLAEARARMAAYPPELSEALVAGLWEADFLVSQARKGVSRSDTAYVSGCLFRLVGVCTHALHGAAGRWLINEKGAVASAAALPGAPAAMRQRVDAIFRNVDVDAAADLVLDTADACARMLR